VGLTHDDVKAKLLRLLGGKNVEMHAFRPHREALETMCQPQVLLLTVNRVAHSDLIVPAKVYEYLPTGNPVLAIGPREGEAAAILEETGAGRCFDYEDTEGVRGFVLKAYALWKEKKLNTGARRFPGLERKKLTGELAGIMNGLLET
jgi:hypothetical protein